MNTITESQLVAYQTHLISSEKSETTADKYIFEVRRFAGWLKDNTCTKELVLAYKAQLMHTYAVSSVNLSLSALNSFFLFCNREDCRVKSIKTQRRVYADADKELTFEEYKRCLAVTKEKDRRLYLLLQTVCATGIRVSELPFITAEAVAVGHADIYNKGKSRQIFLPTSLCEILSQYLRAQNKNSGSVFVTRTGKPLNRSDIWTSFKKLSKAADVPQSKLFPHNLRHLFARRFYQTHHDIVRLADILGHSGINTTRIYTMESGAVHRRQMEELGLVEESGT